MKPKPKSRRKRSRILSEDQALTLLEPHLAGLVEDFHSSWHWVQSMLGQDSERRVTFDASTVAAMLSNRFILLMKQRFEGVERVELKERGRLLRVLIGSEVALRFKKLTKKKGGQLCASNVRTRVQDLIRNQLFAGYKLTELTFGYTADALGEKCTGLYLACPMNWDSNAWISILESDEGEAHLPFAQPAGPSYPSGQTRPAVQSKKSKSRKRNQDDRA